MKKNIVYSLIIAVLVITSLCTLVACNKNDPMSTEITIATPDGAPAISLAGIMKNGLNIDGYKANINILNPEHIGEQVAGEKVDFAIIPSIAAYNLYEKATNTENKEKYLMIGTATYGNLFIVGGKTATEVTNINELKGKVIYSIGRESVPEFVIKTILKDNFKEITNENEIDAEKINFLFVSNGPNVIGKLKEDTNAYGLLGEPAVTASKGKANTKVLFDLQDLYKEATNSTTKGFPQAVLVCKKSIIDNNPQLIKNVFLQFVESAKFANDNITEVPNIIKTNGGAQFPPNAIKGSNVLVKSAKEAKQDTITFIKTSGKVTIDEGFFYIF